MTMGKERKTLTVLFVSQIPGFVRMRKITAFDLNNIIQISSKVEINNTSSQTPCTFFNHKYQLEISQYSIFVTWLS